MSETRTFTRRPYAHIFSIKDLMKTAGSLGSYFFSADSMKFWGSTVSKHIRVAESTAQRPIWQEHKETEPTHINVLFLTREKLYENRDSLKRKEAWTIRVAYIEPREHGDHIEFKPISELGQYKDSGNARRALARLPLSEWTNEGFIETETTK